MDYAHSLQNGAMTRKVQYVHSLFLWSHEHNTPCISIWVLKWALL